MPTLQDVLQSDGEFNIAEPECKKKILQAGNNQSTVNRISLICPSVCTVPLLSDAGCTFQGSASARAGSELGRRSLPVRVRTMRERSLPQARLLRRPGGQIIFSDRAVGPCYLKDDRAVSSDAGACQVF